MIELVELEIDGQKVKVEEGSSIIEAADKMGVYIPRFCYHKKLSIAANCRMCLVEVEKSGKPLPACATPVTPGMKVMTASPRAIDAQRAVMEFLLINHPLDCPICDQGGECELQDLTMGFGRDRSAYEEAKRSVYSKDIGPLVETEMTRCIQCTRCVRFGSEIAGLPELGVINRGEKEEISTYVEHVMQSELSGNIIDICPVGALVNKPARYHGRGWEYREHAMIGPHDCVGGHLFLHTRAMETLKPQRQVMRAVPRENDAINETWMSDRDRYSHFGLYDESRIYKPRLKKEGQWVEVEWQEALLAVAERLKSIAQNQGGDRLAALASPSATVEEFYLLQKLMRQLGSSHIDHRIRWQDFSDQADMPLYPGLGKKIAALETRDVIVLVGSHVRLEQPILGHRINQAHAEGAKIIAINPMDYSFTFDLAHKIIVSPAQLPFALMAVAKALGVTDIEGGEGHFPEADAIANDLRSAKRATILLGEHALHHKHAAIIRALTQRIAHSSHATWGLLTEGANSAGAWLAGAVPHRYPGGEPVDQPGLDVKALWASSDIKAYFLLNIEPELDCAAMADAQRALMQAEYVVCLTPFVNASMESYADVILPMAPFAESGGTFVNAEGVWQSFLPVSVPEEGTQPAWKVLRVLGNLCGFSDFEYKTFNEVRQELQKCLNEGFENKVWNELPLTGLPSLLKQQDQLTRLAPWPMYRVDNITRRSKPLQESMPLEFGSIRINKKTADGLHLAASPRVTALQGDMKLTLPLMIDDRLADNTVLLAAGLAETAGFGQAEATIRLESERV